MGNYEDLLEADVMLILNHGGTANQYEEYHKKNGTDSDALAIRMRTFLEVESNMLRTKVKDLSEQIENLKKQLAEVGANPENPKFSIRDTWQAGTVFQLKNGGKPFQILAQRPKYEFDAANWEIIAIPYKSATELKPGDVVQPDNLALSNNKNRVTMVTDDRIEYASSAGIPFSQNIDGYSPGMKIVHPDYQTPEAVIEWHRPGNEFVNK